MLDEDKKKHYTILTDATNIQFKGLYFTDINNRHWQRTENYTLKNIPKG